MKAKGTPITAVITCPSRIPLDLDRSSARPVVTNIAPKKTPASMANMLPAIYPPESSSKKNKEMPPNVKRTVRISALRNFCLNIREEKIMIKIGAEYCRTMALAEVVILFAAIKNTNTADRKIPDKIEYLLMTNEIFW